MLTHADLCIRAAQWLRSRRRCLAVTIRQMMTREQPDALGWTALGVSTLVECKTSRADFFADASKPHRKHPSLGMGEYRFFLTPKGLIEFEEVPDGWGLLEVRGKTVKQVRQSKHWHQFDHGTERQYLVARVRYGPESWEIPPEVAPVFPDGVQSADTGEVVR